MPDSPFCRLRAIFPWRGENLSRPGKSFLKVGALGSPRKVHLFAKASPFGRGVTAGDGEGEAVNLSAHVQIIQILCAVLGDMLLAARQIVAQ